MLQLLHYILKKIYTIDRLLVQCEKERKEVTILDNNIAQNCQKLSKDDSSTRISRQTGFYFSQEIQSFTCLLRRAGCSLDMVGSSEMSEKIHNSTFLVKISV